MKHLIIILVSLGLIQVCLAQTIKVSCPEAVVSNQSFDLVFEVNAQNISQIKISESPGLQIRNKNNPSRSSMTSINSVNGISKQVVSSTLSYTCIPLIESGTIKTPVLSFKIGNKTLTSKSKTIEILDKAAIADRQQFVCVTSLNTDKVFQGEKIIADVKVFYSEAINEVEAGEFPSINGLLIKEIPLSKIIQSQESYNGKLYNSAIVKRFEISCDSAGVFEIPSVLVTAIKKVRRSNGFFNSYDRERTPLYSEPVSISVTGLPEEVPENYLGVFSDLSVKYQIPAKQTNSDQAVELKIQLNGTGFFKSLTPPDLTDLKTNYTIYEPEIRTSLEDLDFGSEGILELNYTLVPKTIGKTQTEGFNLFYFNRITETFDSLYIKGFDVLVNQSETAEIKDFNANSHEEITSIPVTELTEPSKPLLSKNDYLGALGGMIGMGILLFFGMKINDKKQLAKSLAPAKVGIDKALEDLNELAKSESKDYSSGILETIEDYLIHKFPLKKAEFNKQDIHSLLNPEMATKTISFMKELEMQAFTPASVSGNSSKSKILNRAKNLINEIENS